MYIKSCFYVHEGYNEKKEHVSAIVFFANTAIFYHQYSDALF